MKPDFSGDYVLNRSASTLNARDRSGVPNLTRTTRHVRLEFMSEAAKTPLAPHDLPRDEDLVAAADLLFIELDSRERSE
jgi:hypothetical protein